MKVWVSIMLCMWLIAQVAVAFSPPSFAKLSRHSSMVSMSADLVTESDTLTCLEESDMGMCLEKLEKRINEGPGSLSSSEVSDLFAAMERIVAAANAGAAVADQSPLLDAVSEPIEINAFVPETPAVGDGDEETQATLLIAAENMDVATVSNMLQSGVGMNETTTDAAFWAVVDAVDRAEEEDRALSASITQMLHHVFDADLRHLLTREQITTNVTCMQPDEAVGTAAKARRMNYIFDDSSHKDLPLVEGRVCEGGDCCEACSRNIFPTFTTEDEISPSKFPGLNQLTFNELETVSSASIIQFVRLIERVRRTMAYEYGLPLSTLLPLQAYSRKYVAGQTQQGGGGGEGDFVTLHTDEATHSGYHYSCVIYLSTKGVDFRGGDFVFNDPRDPNDDTPEEKLDHLPLEDQIRRAGRTLTPYVPTRGSAVIFSSGWENMHEVEKITSGIRYAVPAFFTTCPVPEAAYEQMKVGKPQSDEDIADDWLHLLLAHRRESPMEGVGRVKELLMKWHYICTPLSRHYD